MRVTIFTCIVLYSTVVAAGSLDPAVVVSTESPRAGQQLAFNVYLHNPQDNPVRIHPPREVVCQIAIQDKTVALTARRVPASDSAPQSIAPNEFIRITYILMLPGAFQGTAEMTIPALSNARVMFLVAPVRSTVEADETSSNAKVAGEDYASFDSLFALYQPYLGNITAYKPIYFLVGADPENSKFQISFKYRFLNAEGPLAREYPWVKGFHFGFTQTSFWDLKSASMPFEDTSYKPELFFQTANIKSGLKGIQRLFLQGGIQHESNGRGAEYSRSTNVLYLRPIFIWYHENSRFGLQAAPGIWTYLANDEETNPDLADYRGHFDLDLKFGKADSFVLSSILRWAREGASIETDLTYPIHQFSKNFQVYLQAQYVNSLAESLLQYQKRTEALRFGFSIVR